MILRIKLNLISCSSHFGSEQLLNSDIEQVIFILVDGMRYDYTERSPDLRNLLQREDVKRDSKVLFC
jgi:hypothetical protein